MAALVHAALPEEACIVFADEMLCGLLGAVRQVWAPRGMAVRQPVQQVRAYQYLHLAVATQTGQLWWRWEPRMHGAAVLAAVQQWHAAGVGAVIWDNAGSHQDFLVQASGLAFIGLPAYAPELNPAERLFRELRRVCEGRPYATLAEKIAVVEQELLVWAAAPDRVKALCHWEWIEEAMSCFTEVRT